MYVKYLQYLYITPPFIHLPSGFETEQAEIEADRLVLEGKTEEKNTLMESIEELKEGIETKKGEVKKMENDLVGKYCSMCWVP